MKNLICATIILFLTQQGATTPIVEAKHFKKDPFFPSITIPIINLSDLDLLDYIFGSLEGTVGRDVRKDYLVCYNNQTIMGIFTGMWNKGLWTMFTGMWTMMTSKTIDQDFRTGIFEPECDSVVEDVYHQLEAVLTKFADMGSMDGQLSELTNGFDIKDPFKQLKKVWNDIPPMFTAVWEHDFYEFGRIYTIYNKK